MNLSLSWPPGLTVVTRSPDSNNVASSAVGTALPKFAIRGMLKTFGLHGVVLDVDSVSKRLSSMPVPCSRLSVSFLTSLSVQQSLWWHLTCSGAWNPGRGGETGALLSALALMATASGQAKQTSY